MRKCWAAHLGNCSNKISAEHIISDSFFRYDPPHVIEVSGFRWLRGGRKIIPPSELTRNISCETHNNALSDVDMAGKEAFDVFRKVSHVASLRSKSNTVKQYQINGLLLERWFVKTLINMIYKDSLPIGHPLGEIGMPSNELVEIAFGLTSFQFPFGLYHIFLQDLIYSSDRIEFAPFIKHDNSYVAGGLFSFRGFKFLLFFGHEKPPQNLTNVKLGETSLGNSKLYYRPPKIGFRLDSIPFQEIKIKW